MLSVLYFFNRLNLVCCIFLWSSIWVVWSRSRMPLWHSSSKSRPGWEWKTWGRTQFRPGINSSSNWVVVNCNWLNIFRGCHLLGCRRRSRILRQFLQVLDKSSHWCIPWIGACRCTAWLCQLWWIRTAATSWKIASSQSQLRFDSKDQGSGSEFTISQNIYLKWYDLEYDEH